MKAPPHGNRTHIILRRAVGRGRHRRAAHVAHERRSVLTIINDDNGYQESRLESDGDYNDKRARE